MINEEIFHAYDVRGIYPEEINEEAAYKIGQAFAAYINGDVVIGRDVRPSSLGLFENFTKGFTTMGFDIVDLGACPTPMVNFAVAHKNYVGGVIITASHSPKQYNGIKLIGARAVQLNSDKGMPEIKALVQKNIFQTAGKPGNFSQYDILPEYKKFILKKIGSLKKFNLVVDYGNGMGSISAKPVFEELNQNIISLYDEPDGTFPNHPANPVDEENLEDAKKAVLTKKADLGVVFDGDADRAFFIDENGQTIPTGFLTAAIASNELKSHPSEKVYIDLRFSRGVIKAIEKVGGIPEKTKVGNPFYKQKLILEGGLMAAEYSGHVMYKENYGLDDGLFSALKVLYWLDKTNKKMSEFVGEFSQGYYLTGEVNLEVKDNAAAIKAAEEKYADGKIDKIDGVTVEFPDWWFNLRVSNTEPVVRLNIEANSAKLLEEKKRELIKLIKNY